MTSTPTYRALERASESLYEDERLRSNLTDAEADIVLKWATEWLSDRTVLALDEAGAQHIVQVESQRVRATLASLNALAANPDLSLVQTANALEPTLNGGKPFSREEILILLTTLTSSAWRLRG